MSAASWVKRAREGGTESRTAAWGWDGDDFVLGTSRLTGAGTRKEPLSHSLLRESRAMAPRGSLAPWVAMVKHLVGLDAWQVGWAVLLSLGCPLWRYVHLPGATWMFSGPTGVGKTLALLAAQSVWGVPRRQFIPLESTVQKVLACLVRRGTLPAAMDEIGLMAPHRFARLAYLVAEGYASCGEWRTLLLCSSNVHALHKLLDNPRVNAAQAYRVFDSHIEERPRLTTTVGVEACTAFDANAGTLGHAWARLLVSNAAGLPERIVAWREWFAHRMAEWGHPPFLPEERFWEGMVATAWTAGHWARQARLVDLDPDRLVQPVLDQVARHRADVSEMRLAPLRQLTAYLGENLAHLVVVTRRHKQGLRAFTHAGALRLKWPKARLEVLWGRKGSVKSMREAGAEVLGPPWTSQLRLWIAIKPYGEWLRDRGHPNLDVLMQLLREYRALVDGPRRYALARGLHILAACETKCIVIDVDRLRPAADILPEGLLAFAAPVKSRTPDLPATSSPPAVSSPTTPDPGAASSPPSAHGSPAC